MDGYYLLIDLNENSTGCNPNSMMQWNQSRVDSFWDTLFQEVKDVLLLYAKNKQINTINASVMVNPQGKYYHLSFHNIKFPALSDDLQKYAKSNNKWILQNQFNNCTFIDNCFIQTHGIKQLSINSDIQFINCIFHHNLVVFRPSCKNEKILLIGCEIKKGIKLQSSFDNIHMHNIKANSLYIGSRGVGEEYNIDEYNIGTFIYYQNNIKKICFNQIVFDDFQINSLNGQVIEFHKILFESSKFTKMNIKNIKTKLLVMRNSNILENAKILLEHMETKVLKIDGLSQDSRCIRLDNITVSNKLEFNKVDFRNTYFNNFDILNAEKKIDKTSFIDAHLNSIKWGKIFKIDAKKDIFRQLKFVNDSQGNHIDANNFYAMEMTKHGEELNSKSWFSNWWQEKLVFLLGKKISNHGQSWFLPLLLILLSSLFFYTISHLFKIEYSEVSIQVKVFWVIISTFISFLIGQILYEFGNWKWKRKTLYTLKYIIPILSLVVIINICHFGTMDAFVQFMGLKPPKEEFEGVLIWWLINKIVTGFLFYHFIIALRRQTKR